MEQLYDVVMDRMDLTRDIGDEELMDMIHEAIREAAEAEYMPLQEQIRLSRQLFHSFRKLDVLQELVEDETITEIMINGTDEIFLEREGRIIQSDRKFMSIEKLEDVIQQIVAGTNRYVNELSPIVDARLEDGSRVNVVLKPVALNGPIMTIRKFPKDTVTMDQLISWGSVTEEVVEFVKMIVKAKYNIFVSGGTGSGKTTFLNAMSDYIPKDERIITIEDNAELQIRGVPNLVRLEARNANLEGEGAVTIRDLIKSALRMRPDRIIVGEVRGAEAVDLLQALNTGHEGSLSTAHANSPEDMVSRLETMVLMGMQLPLEAVRRQIASGIDIFIQLGRDREKKRKVMKITEVTGCEENGVCMQTLFERNDQTGALERSGELCHTAKLEKANLS